MDGTDPAVVARARGGDHDAFRTLVDRHGRAVFRVAYRLTGHEQDAEDVVQETFLRAYRQLDKFEARSSFATWLYRIAFNCAHDLLRQRPRMARHTSIDAESGEGGPLQLADESPARNPHRQLESAEIDRRVREGLSGLSEMERAAFVLRHFEGQSIEDIGKTLGLQTSATKHSIFRAVQKMRRVVAPLVGEQA
jgi:RNA polymerase sigma-70 factor (ECF subfamily)